MSNYYCKYCGARKDSIASLTANLCFNHPDGIHKGKHALYEGDEKSKYICKYCGAKKDSIASLTANLCFDHPDGTNKGKHSPAI